MKISRTVGTTDEILQVFIQDSTVSTGAGLANIVASSVNFTWLRNDQATFSSGKCTSTGTLGTFTVSSLTQMSSSLMLGWYQFDPPNGVFTSGTSAAIHLYGAPNMAPLPMEVELTKFDNQQYVSSYNISTQAGGVRVSSTAIQFGVSTIVPVGVSSPAGVSSFAIRVGVSTAVGVSSGTWVASVSTMSTEVGVSTIVPVGVSSRVGVSTLVGVSSGTWQVGVSTLNTEAGVSTIVPVGVSSGRVSVSTLVGVSTLTIPVGVSSGRVSVSTLVGVSTLTIPVGVSTGTWLAGVSTVTDKTAYTLDSTYGPAGSISTNIVQVRGIAVASGTGTSSDPWGP